MSANTIDARKLVNILRIGNKLQKKATTWQVNNPNPTGYGIKATKAIDVFKDDYYWLTFYNKLYRISKSLNEILDEASNFTGNKNLDVMKDVEDIKTILDKITEESIPGLLDELEMYHEVVNKFLKTGNHTFLNMLTK